jgi:CelD/BcsL family acetyltransferase involved in cellulose biosynthesis
LDFSIHKDFPDSLDKDWNGLLDESISHVPFLRYEYLKTWWETRGGGEWPQSELMIITAREQDRLIGIAPLFLAEYEGKRSLLLLGSIEISDYLDLIVRPPDAEAFISGLLTFLDSKSAGGWETLDLFNILSGSPSLELLQKAAGAHAWKATISQLQHSPYIPLPGDWESYLEGIDKKQRHEIRRKMRRVEEAGSSVRWYILEDASLLDESIESFMALMANDPDKAKFLTPLMRDHMRNSARCAFDAGCLNLSFLEVGGEKAAGYMSFDYLNRLWIYNSGIDRRFMEYSPGWVLLGYLLKWANENKKTEFDFMRGNEDYKYKFGAVDRFVMRARFSR